MLMGTIRAIPGEKGGGMRSAGFRFLLSAALMGLLIWCACARMPEPGATAGPEALEEVLARRAVFDGLQGHATFSLKHQNESFSLPFDIKVSRDLNLEVTGEISHFLLPFEGGFRLINDGESTLLHTNAGVYDLGAMPEAGKAIRPFLLSLAGGGDWVAWWLAEQGCEPRSRTSCAGMEIELEAHAKLPSVEGWRIQAKEQGRTFQASVIEYERGTLVPRTIKGTLYPEEITIYVEYSEISRGAGPSG